VAWETDPSNKMAPEAKAIVKRVLKEHVPAPVDKSILKEGAELIVDYEKKFEK